MNKIGLGTLLLVFFSIQGSAWGLWKKVIIKGAYCGDGLPYSVFIKPGNPKQLTVGLMGGGGCWSFSTCFGPNNKTWIHPLPAVALNKAIGPFFNKTGGSTGLRPGTQVFFPYCTGDVFAGTHKARYFKTPFYHYGKINVEKSLKQLTESRVITWEEVEKIVLYGTSAGAMGALFHTKTFDKYLRDSTERVLISDSAGLHFGKDFWKRFPRRLVKDYRDVFVSLGLKFDRESGHLASQIKDYCKLYSQWRVGFLQASYDIVMSAVFGKTRPKDHHKEVFGKSGILRMTQNPRDNCSSWVIPTYHHSLILFSDVLLRKVEEKTAWNFIKDVILGIDSLNYPYDRKTQEE